MDNAILHTPSAAQVCGIKSIPTPIPSLPCAPTPKGLRAWLPALVVLIGMPVLALAATKYVLLPSVKSALSSTPYSAASLDAGTDSINVIMAKVPLNDTAPLGRHSDFRSITLIGATPEFKAVVSENRIKLATMAASTLSRLTLNDLEKPGRLDSVRAELLSNLNQVLGSTAAKEVYITVWPHR